MHKGGFDGTLEPFGHKKKLHLRTSTNIKQFTYIYNILNITVLIVYILYTYREFCQPNTCESHGYVTHAAIYSRSKIPEKRITSKEASRWLRDGCCHVAYISDESSPRCPSPVIGTDPLFLDRRYRSRSSMYYLTRSFSRSRSPIRYPIVFRSRSLSQFLTRSRC